VKVFDHPHHWILANQLPLHNQLPATSRLASDAIIIISKQEYLCIFIYFYEPIQFEALGVEEKQWGMLYYPTEKARAACKANKKSW